MSSIRILGACHIAQNRGERGAFHLHPTPFISVELFFMVLVTVNIESVSLSSIRILGLYYIAQKRGKRGTFHMHLSPSISVELFTMMLVTINNKI